MDSVHHSEGSETRTNEAILRGMWMALRAGRIDEMLEFVHPEVVWRPLSRPGLSRYDGHAGLRRMLEEREASIFSNRWIDFDDIVEGPPDHLRVRGRAMSLDEEGNSTVISIEFVFVMRDGLVYEVDTLPGEQSQQ